MRKRIQILVVQRQNNASAHPNQQMPFGKRYSAHVASPQVPLPVPLLRRLPQSPAYWQLRQSSSPCAMHDVRLVPFLFPSACASPLCDRLFFGAHVANPLMGCICFFQQNLICFGTSNARQRSYWKSRQKGGSNVQADIHCPVLFLRQTVPSRLRLPSCTLTRICQCAAVPKNPDFQKYCGAAWEIKSGGMRGGFAASVRRQFYFAGRKISAPRKTGALCAPSG